MFTVRNENLSLGVIFLQNLQGVSSLVYLNVTIIASNYALDKVKSKNRLSRFAGVLFSTQNQMKSKEKIIKSAGRSLS